MNTEKPTASRPAAGLSRRTIVTAAAWSAPAIVLTVTSPAAAASGPAAHAIEFVRVPGPVAPGSTYGDVVVAAVDGGAPAAAGGVITVTLTGAHFADGSTVAVVVATGSPHSATISGIVADTGGGIASAQIVATYLTATVTAALGVRELPVGYAYGWGYNGQGQVGDGGALTTRSTPSAWLGGRTYSSIAPAWSSFAAVAADGLMYATGNNASGPFGNGQTSGSSPNGPVGPVLQASSPKLAVPAIGPFRKALHVMPGVSSHDQTIWVRGTDGKVYAFGENSADKFSLSDGTNNGGADAASAHNAVEVGTQILAANPGTAILSVDDSGWYRAVYLLSDGTVWHSGSNRSYAFGNAGVLDRQYLAAQTITSDKSPLTNIVAAVSSQDAAMYLDGDGNLWGSGSNAYGQLPGAAASSPTAVRLNQPAGKKVSRIWSSGADADSFAAEAVDGSFYIVGYNSSGQGSTGANARCTNAWTPILVPDGKTIVDISFGGATALYLMSDGSVYFAGVNSTGGAGNGTTSGTITTMQQVPLAAPALAVAANFNNSFAVIVAPEA